MTPYDLITIKGSVTWLYFVAPAPLINMYCTTIHTTNHDSQLLTQTLTSPQQKLPSPVPYLHSLADHRHRRHPQQQSTGQSDMSSSGSDTDSGATYQPPAKKVRTAAPSTPSCTMDPASQPSAGSPTAPTAAGANHQPDGAAGRSPAAQTQRGPSEPVLNLIFLHPQVNRSHVAVAIDQKDLSVVVRIASQVDKVLDSSGPTPTTSQEKRKITFQYDVFVDKIIPLLCDASKWLKADKKHPRIIHHDKKPGGLTASIVVNTHSTALDLRYDLLLLHPFFLLFFYYSASQSAHLTGGRPPPPLLYLIGPFFSSFRKYSVERHDITRTQIQDQLKALKPSDGICHKLLSVTGVRLNLIEVQAILRAVAVLDCDYQRAVTYIADLKRFQHAETQVSTTKHKSNPFPTLFSFFPAFFRSTFFYFIFFHFAGHGKVHQLQSKSEIETSPSRIDGSTTV